jgi:hypothetical protein
MIFGEGQVSAGVRAGVALLLGCFVMGGVATALSGEVGQERPEAKMGALFFKTELSSPDIASKKRFLTDLELVQESRRDGHPTIGRHARTKMSADEGDVLVVGGLHGSAHGPVSSRIKTTTS